jgi:ribosomal protein L29
MSKFKELTSASTLSDCIQETDVKQSGKKWLKIFNNILHRSFKKIRVTNRKMKNDDVHLLLRAKSQIVRQLESDPSDIEEESKILVSLQENVDRLESRIADISAEKNMKTIKEHFETITDGSGNFNIPKMWGLKKKLNLTSNDVPSAKKDEAGNLITSRNGILALYKKTYVERLSHKAIQPQYDDLKTLKENLFELRYQISTQNKSEDLEVSEIVKIFKSLKGKR